MSSAVRMNNSVVAVGTILIGRFNILRFIIIKISSDNWSNFSRLAYI